MPNLSAGIQDLLTAMAASRPAQAYQALGNEMNTGLGAMVGMARTRRLPRIGPEGRLIFDVDENSPPMAMGDTLFAPPTMSERSLAHENIHQKQSQQYGFAYPLLSALGGYGGPLEREALLKTRDVGSDPNDAIADKFALDDTRSAERDSKLQQLLYRMYRGVR